MTEEVALETPKVDEKEEEIAQLKDRLLRLAAEFDNYKKAAIANQNNSIKYANESILQSFLPIIDNLEMALLMKDSIKEKAGLDLLVGVEMVLKIFSDTLAKFGVTHFVSKGEIFDPKKHEAIAQKEEEGIEPNKVLLEYQKGYMLHDRLLRAARVVVSK